ncbi:MAG TPA: hypothetical protein VIF62_26650, partial [Labilithrix sp.]
AYFPGSAACNASHLPSDPTMDLLHGVGIDRATKTQSLVAKSFAQRPGDAAGSALSPRNGADNMEGALHDAYNALATGSDTKGRAFATYYRRAVVVLGNRGFTGNACYTAPSAQAAANLTASKIKTYVVVLANNHDAAAQADFFADANALAVAGGTAHAYDGRSNKNNAIQAFLDIEHDLASCAYDVDPPATPPIPGDKLSYTDPLTGNTTLVSYDASCKNDAAASTANGWGIDETTPTRVRICGTNPGGACDAYHTVATTAAQYAAINRQPALAVPMFAHHAACAPTSGVPGTPASSGGGSLDASAPAPDGGH